MKKVLTKDEHVFERVVKEKDFMVFKVSKEDNENYFEYWALATNQHREVVVTNINTGESRAIHWAWQPYSFTLADCANFILGVINKKASI